MCTVGTVDCVNYDTIHTERDSEKDIGKVNQNVFQVYKEDVFHFLYSER